MATEIRYRSETIRVKVTLTVDGVAADLDDYVNIIFILYYQTNAFIRKFSREVVATYDSDNFMVIDAATGRFDILIQPSVSLPASLENVRGEILVKKTDADWEDNLSRTIVSGIELFKMRNAQTKLS